MPDTQSPADHFGKTLTTNLHSQLQGLANIVDGLGIKFGAKERPIGGLPFSAVPAKRQVKFMRRKANIGLSQPVASIAGPPVLARGNNHARPYRIEFGVSLASQQVAFGFTTLDL